jgi:micrococcal nuclease
MSTTNNEYDVDIVRVVDGDTVDVDIHLGFNIVLRNERVRIVGIDTPASRTSDPVEKVFGLAAKRRVHELLLNTENIRLITTENSKGEDMRGKFGRVLGDFRVNKGHILAETLVEEGHAVPYFGGSKDHLLEQHLANRRKLVDSGVVDLKNNIDE